MVNYHVNWESTLGSSAFFFFKAGKFFTISRRALAGEQSSFADAYQILRSRKIA